MSRSSTYEKCQLWFCNDDHYGRGLCARHWQSFVRSKRAIADGATPLSRDLFVLLSTIKEFREIVRELTMEERVLGPIFMEINAPGLEFRHCYFCGSAILTDNGKAMTSHKPDCPVGRSKYLLEMTANGPEEVLGDRLGRVQLDNHRLGRVLLDNSGEQDG